MTKVEGAMLDGQHKVRREQDEADEGRSLRGLVVLATVVAVDELGPVLDADGVPGLGAGVRPTQSVIELGPGALGSRVALAFLDGDRARPIVLGRVAESGAELEARGSEPVVIADGQRLRIEAERELVLCCGEASITLRANGRLVIRGDYVETRAKGVNRIRGGSVAIN